MSNSEAANIFCHVFEILSEEDDETARNVAKKIWTGPEMQTHDFSPGDLYCDDALIQLRLAVMVTPDRAKEVGLSSDEFDPDEQEDGIVYAPPFGVDEILWKRLNE